MSRTSARRVVPSSCRRRITRDRASVASAPLCARERVPVERTARDYGGPGKRARRGRRDTRLPHRRVNAILKPSCTPGQRLSPLARSTLQLSFSLSLSLLLSTRPSSSFPFASALCVYVHLCVYVRGALCTQRACSSRRQMLGREKEREQRGTADGCFAERRRGEPSPDGDWALWSLPARSWIARMFIASMCTYIMYTTGMHAYTSTGEEMWESRERERERTSREDE